MNQFRVLSNRSAQLSALVAVFPVATLVGVPAEAAFIIAVLVSLIAYGISAARRRRMLRAWYAARPVFYREWLARFGMARRADIKRFLRAYAAAFFVHRTIVHKLSPDDRVLDYYHREYSPGEADALDGVFFARSLKRDFGYGITEADFNLSLGQLFERASRHR